MWRWGISSRLAAVVLAVCALPSAAGARVLHTVDEALALAFPGCSIERRTEYLTEEQLARARELAGIEVASALVRPYVATCGGTPGGTAYFDSHRVRTLPETLMVVIDPEGRVERLEVLSFDEPPEYLPREVWYRQFPGEELDGELELGRGIDGVTGATLTARATTAAVRRILAVDRVLREAGP